MILPNLKGWRSFDLENMLLISVGVLKLSQFMGNILILDKRFGNYNYILKKSKRKKYIVHSCALNQEEWKLCEGKLKKKSVKVAIYHALLSWNASPLYNNFLCFFVLFDFIAPNFPKNYPPLTLAPLQP